MHSYLVARANWCCDHWGIVASAGNLKFVAHRHAHEARIVVAWVTLILLGNVAAGVTESKALLDPDYQLIPITNYADNLLEIRWVGMPRRSSNCASVGRQGPAHST